MSLDAISGNDLTHASDCQDGKRVTVDVSDDHDPIGEDTRRES